MMAMGQTAGFVRAFGKCFSSEAPYNTSRAIAESCTNQEDLMGAREPRAKQNDEMCTLAGWILGMRNLQFLGT